MRLGTHPDKQEEHVDDVVVLSRAGARSVPADVATQIKEHANLEFVTRMDAPGGREAADLLRDATILATTNVTLPRLDADLLAACPRLRRVVLYATGYEHIDLDVLDAHGVSLSVLPEYATPAVAEHALGLALALATRVHLANDRSRGRVPATTSLRGIELGGRTLGIIGVGRIGSHLAGIAGGIGMHVIGSDTDRAARVAAQERGMIMTDTGELLERADVVALCCSTHAQDPLVVGAPQLRRMRPGGLLVSIGRPALVDHPAVDAAIRSGHLRGYAVFDPDSDLVTQGRVLQTDHSAWWRDEVLERGAEQFGAAILAAARDTPVDVVTADALTGRRVA